MSDFGDALPRMGARAPHAVSAAWVERLAESECPGLTARRARRAEATGAPQDPIVWTRARGFNVQDVDGNVYVDATSGFGAAFVGHGHPRVRAALGAQAERLLHALGDVHPSEAKIELLEALRGIAPWPGARVMLGLGGADAVEAAMKTGMLASGRPGVLAFDGSYHGLSFGALSVSGYSEKFRAPFARSLLDHVHWAPFPAATTTVGTAMDAVRAAWREEIGTVLVEPIQGRAGVRVPPAGFLEALAEEARARGAVLVLDEILTGLGRTGERWGAGAAAAMADVICVGKALGGGMPVSACLGREEVMAAWGTSEGEAIHTGTFFGQPLAARAALETLRIVEEEGLAAAARSRGAALRAALEAAAAHAPGGAEVRGRGLLLGVDLGRPLLGLTVTRALLERGFLALPMGRDGAGVQLLPPACFTAAASEALAGALAHILSQLPADGTARGAGP